MLSGAAGENQQHFPDEAPEFHSIGGIEVIQVHVHLAIQGMLGVKWRGVGDN